MRETIQAKLDETWGDVDVQALESVSGGSINRAAIVRTNRGNVFAKWNDTTAPPDLFVREEEALRTMRSSDTSLTIPEPIASAKPAEGEPGFLIMEYLDPSERAEDFDERLGRGLARLHSATSEEFGFDRDNYCGTTPQPNAWTDSWIEFYREHRLRHQLELAVEHRQVSRSDRRTYERLLDRLDELLVGGAPALLHGDLWSGNLYTDSNGEPALIDPAAYYGHPEAEIGMMELFGGFSDRVYDAYEEVRTLPDGWRDRIPLYSLYHLMNHFNLFGGHYGRQAFDVVRRFAG